MSSFCRENEQFQVTTSSNVSNATLEFSECFQLAVFNLVPCYFIWGFFAFYLLATHYRKPGPYSQSSTRLYTLKLVFTVLLWISSWSMLIYNIIFWFQSPNVLGIADFISPLIIGLTMCLALLMTMYDKRKGFTTSMLLTCFWIACILSWVVTVVSQVQKMTNSEETLSQGDIVYIVTFFLSYLCAFVNLVLCFFPDVPKTVLKVSAADGSDIPLTESSTKPSKQIKSPEKDATFLSKVSFWWFNGMVMFGFKQPLKDEHLWALNDEDQTKNVAASFMERWQAEQKSFAEKHPEVSQAPAPEKAKPVENEALVADSEKKTAEEEEKKEPRPSLLKAMVKTYGPHFATSIILKMFQDALGFVSPQLLSYLIQFIGSPDAPNQTGYIIAVAMLANALLQSIILQSYFHVTFVAGMRIRSGIVSVVYRKALLLSNAAKKTSTVGEIVNLMSVDAQRFMDLMGYLNIVWSGPFQIILAIYFLWQEVGPSVLAGVAVMILLIPVNGVLATKSRALQVKQMKHKDERIKLMNEILNGIKVLKMYAWEMSFKDKISDIRKKELEQLKNTAYLGAISSFTFVTAPFLVSLVTFAVYVLSDDTHVLNAQKAFVSLALFNLLRFPMMMLPNIITSMVQASVSLNRLEKFLCNGELDTSNVDRTGGKGAENAITIDNGTFKWSPDEKATLTDVSVKVQKGSLVAVVGHVGSGKSSLISALLGDMEKVAGNVKVQGKVAYASQQAWIQNLTVRDNITFGKQMDVCKYQDVVEACQLKSDFEMLPAGDETEIGERGINLSGGQKQRVSIARAVYQDAQVYFFDDPLSAVDAHVGKNIFDLVLGPKGCLNNTTRILVTHGVGFLNQCDQIIVLKDGKISEVGDYSTLLEKGEAFAEFLKTYAEKVEEEEGGDNQDEIGESDGIDVTNVNSESPVRNRTVSSASASSVSKSPLKRELSKNGEVQDKVCKLPENKKSDHKLVEAEKAETGSVKLSIFITYMRAIGYLLCLLVCILYIVQNAASIYSNIWLSEWSNDPVDENGTQNNTDVRLAVYGGLGMIQGALGGLTQLALTLSALSASSILHEKMIMRLMRAPMSFLEQTPTGRIINRCGKDVDVMDNILIRVMSWFLSCFFRVVGTIIVICMATPIFTVSLVPLGLLYYFIQRFYIRTSRQLKRLESVSRSPIYSHFSESIAGASTIRAYGLSSDFIVQNEQMVDRNQMAYYPNIVSNRWLALRLEIIGNSIVFFAALFAVAARDTINPGIVGLSVTYAMQVTQTLNWMVRQTSELETNIVAVERVQEYTQVDQEAPLIFENNRPPTDWPSQGTIEFNQYSTRYRPELDLVVRGINANIRGGEKIGIVGRTGAGKSSLTLALFRIIESAEGNITIDGVDISKMGLQDLRSKLSIIPQDPVLFSGTLRLNLDPFDVHSDEEIWHSLEHSHLKKYVSELPDKLSHMVAEGGENLSVGQRQLVCLARALLRKSKILVLDEATAAVDLETDDLIQATIRSEFSNCTTFTIAHRLNTIMDSDRVLVLDAGKVVEFDSPGELLKRRGIFHGMAKDAGLI